MWLDPEEVSSFGYEYSRSHGKDRAMAASILTSKWAYYYCRDIHDDPNVRKIIIDSKWAYYYCISIKDRPEVRKYVQGTYLDMYNSVSSDGGKENLDRQLNQCID
jgi:hypothetical protein